MLAQVPAKIKTPQTLHVNPLRGDWTGCWFPGVYFCIHILSLHTSTAGALICEEKSMEAHFTDTDKCCLSLRSGNTSCSAATVYECVCEEEKRCVCVCGGGAARKKYVERPMQC